MKKNRLLWQLIPALYVTEGDDELRDLYDEFKRVRETVMSADIDAFCVMLMEIIEAELTRRGVAL